MMCIIFKSNSRCQFKVKIPISNSRYQLEVFSLKIYKHSRVFVEIDKEVTSKYTNISIIFHQITPTLIESNFN